MLLTSLRVIVATACQLVYLPRLYEDNSTLRGFPYHLSVQFVQFASISTACIVYFLPFFRSLQSGLVWANSTTNPSKYSLSAMPKGTKDTTSKNSEFNNSNSRGRRDYVQIVTENSVISETRTYPVELYRPSW